MKLIGLKGMMIVFLICVGGLFMFYFFLKPKLISVKKIENNGTVDVVFVGPEKYHNSFAESLRRAQDSAKPFHEAGDLMEAGRYDEALEALDESLQKSTRRIEKLMVYDRMQKVYQKMGSKEKELWALEKEIEYTREGPGRQELRQRAAEIRQLLAAKNETNQ